MNDSRIFGHVYADFYDTVYSDKDYDVECAVIRDLIDRFGIANPRRILDLGCGTGEHALRLAASGFEVAGIDLSPAMLALAEGKAAKSGLSIDFRVGDLRVFQLGETFDVALMMFAVLGYQHSNADVRAALARSRHHLVDGGLLMFDVWYGPAVLRIGPERRSRHFEHGGLTLVRKSAAEIDPHTQICDVEIQITSSRDRVVEAATNERHQMRYFFANELDLFLSVAGFDLIQLTAFPHVDDAPSVDTWNVLAVARAVS